MASFKDIWTNLRETGKPTPYLLIDCAGIEGGSERIPRQIFSELECLFTGDLALELADVGPYLGRLRSFELDVASAVDDMLLRFVGILVELEGIEADGTEPSFSDIHRHFRKFNLIYGPHDDPLFFRYYDPRVIGDVLRTFSADQLEEFFGPVEAFVFADMNLQLLRCEQLAGVIAVSA